MADAGADPCTLPGNDPWASSWPPANLASNIEPNDPGTSVQPAQATNSENVTGTAAPPNAGQDQNGEWWGNHSWAAENPARGDNADGEDGRRPSTTSTSTTTTSQRPGNDRWQWHRGDDRWWSYWDGYGGWWGDGSSNWRSDDRNSGSSHDLNKPILPPINDQMATVAARRLRRRPPATDLDDFGPILRMNVTSDDFQDKNPINPKGALAVPRTPDMAIRGRRRSYSFLPSVAKMAMATWEHRPAATYAKWLPGKNDQAGTKSTSPSPLPTPPRRGLGQRGVP